MYLKLAKIENKFGSQSRLGSVTQKPVAFEDAYLPPVANKPSGVRILNINQLHNNEQLVNSNQQLFFI